MVPGKQILGEGGGSWWDKNKVLLPPIPVQVVLKLFGHQTSTWRTHQYNVEKIAWIDTTYMVDITRFTMKDTLISWYLTAYI